MFSSTDKAAREARELAFRKAAAANNTAKMIELSQGINVNAVADGETSSLQTAAHRAAAAGHVEALRLLYNLGADFSLSDKNKQAPRDLVKPDDHKALQFFRLISDASSALQTRKLFYPVTIDELDPSDARYKEHHAAHSKLSEEIQEGPLYIEFFNSYKREAKLNHDYDLSDAQQFMEEFNHCLSYLRYLEATKVVIEKTVKSNKTFCACGEASAICAMTLAHRDQVAYPVEVLNIMSKVEDSGHACVILGRNTRMTVNNHASMNDALILDPLKNRIFFYQFVKQYKENTVFKVLERFDLKLSFTNQAPAFPTVMKFPKTKAFYAANTLALAAYVNDALRERCVFHKNNM